MSDRVFGTIDRSYKNKTGEKKKEELRVALGEYQGKQFVSLRVWYQGTQDADKMFPDKAKGMTIKLKELSQVIDALQRIEAEQAGVELKPAAVRQSKLPQFDLPTPPADDSDIPF